uniref:Alkane 1-monooxygenase n=1 Tax=uncultured Flavobacteriia bacterium TaxID=212695 RepID=H6RH95_9BACT|nr:alkane-1 monooxygenase [uncultured bacterium]CCG00366.1 Alkane 1-monooxygenase [uncultured Flavobacteriia bacterium]CCG00406.1 1-monooxygenase AltName: Full=Alkane hydroxylase Short=AHs AltName: Full=Terminal alkane [uncultured Flavobacteriia bacterium]
MKDLKYLMSYSIALMAFIGISLGGFYNFLAVIFTFIFIPILEIIVKKSDEEYTEEEKKNRLLDPFFDLLLYFNIPIVFGIFFFSLDKLIYTSSISDIIGIILSASIVMATNGINVGHELGHRKSIIARTCSKLLYLPCQYMHFYIEHNFGHHINVATPEDPATARYKQTLYSFWITSVVRTYVSAWQIQFKLLKVSKRNFFSIKNDMVFYTFFQIIFLAFVYYNFGLYLTLLSILMSIISFLFLETINYVEHYGLLRKKEPSGRYERVKPHHSWNSNHTIGRIVLYELTRHSDHHFKSSKKYQVLESLDNCPHLPFGYPTSILLSLIPPIWFNIMNPLVRNHMGYTD